MFREFQNEINRLSRRLGEVQNTIIALQQARAELSRDPIGPAGNCFDRQAQLEIDSALAVNIAEAAVLQQSLSNVRLRLHAAMAQPVEAAA